MPLFLMAQSRNIVIDWNLSSTNKSISDKKSNQVSISKYETATRSSLQLTETLVIYQEQWHDQGYADENSLKITNVVYGNLSVSEFNKINKELIPDELFYTIKSSKARSIIFTSFSISPIIKTELGYKKVLSFSMIYSIKKTSRVASKIAISNSVLATGDWYKFKVEKTGIHRISRNFLEDLGMNINGINPRNIKIYGNGGKPLPLLNEENTVFDLIENSIKVVGEEDGTFGGSDFILFYGTNTLGYSGENFDTNINPYSDESYYYITVDGESGKRVQEMVEPIESPTKIISQFNDYQYFEEDDFSPARVGRRWFGNSFDIENEQSFVFDFPNIISGQAMQIKVKVASASETETSMAISVNNTSLDPLIFSPINDPTLLSTRDFEGEIPAGSETVTFNLTYSNAGNPNSKGYLDYISVDAFRQLSGAGGQLAFRFNEADMLPGIAEYQISNASQFSEVWDVTNIGFISSKENTGNNPTFTFKADLGELREYVAVHPNNYFLPVLATQSSVPNQNLKGTIFNSETGNFKDIDYLIVCPPFLIQPALRLADYRRKIDGLNIKVITTDLIYNEFSSGKQDIGAIRNFVRYIYENASSENARIRYLCLFGDSSVDYKDRF